MRIFDLVMGWTGYILITRVLYIHGKNAVVVFGISNLYLGVAEEFKGYTEYIDLDEARKLIKRYTKKDIEDIRGIGGEITYKMDGVWYVGPTLAKHEAVFLDAEGKETDMKNAAYVVAKVGENVYKHLRTKTVIYEIRRGNCRSCIYSFCFEYINGYKDYYNDDWIFKGIPDKLEPEKMIRSSTPYGAVKAALVNGEWYIASPAFDSVYVGKMVETNIGLVMVDEEADRIIIVDDLDEDDLSWDDGI